jgi:hypothetical protein
MNRESLKLFAVFLFLLGITALVLLRMRNPNLGTPGVKVSNAPLYGEKSNVVAKVSVALPEQVPGFVLDNPSHTPISQMELSVLPLDTTFGRKRYLADDRSQFNVQINAILMGTDRASIHPPQFCITGQGWQITSTELIDIPIKKPVPYNLKAMKMNTSIGVRTRDGKTAELHGIFIYWFVADGLLTPSRGERMWLIARELLTHGKLDRWAYISYFSTCFPGQENATFERLRSFITATVPEFQITTGTPERVSAQTADTFRTGTRLENTF